MQDSFPEDNRRTFPAWVPVLAVVCVLAGVAAVAARRHGGAPPPAVVLAGDVGWAGRGATTMLAALAAGLAVAFVASAWSACRRHGGLAVLAASVLATGGTLVLAEPGRAFVAVAGWPWWLAVGVSGLALLLVPWLRERGLGSLCWVPAVAVTPLLLAIRAAWIDQRDADPIAAAWQAAGRLAGNPGPILLQVDEGADPAMLRALVLALRRPFWPMDLDLLTATHDGLPAQWLRRLGLPTLRWQGRELHWLDANGRLPPPSTLPAELELLPAAGARVRVQAAPGPVLGVLFTPLGTVDLAAVAERPEAPLLPAAGDRARLGELLRSSPPGSLIRGLVVGRDSPAAYGVADLRLAPARP